MTIFDPLLDRIRGRPPIVSVVPMRGVIGSHGLRRPNLSLEALAPALEAAFRPKHVTAVALLIDSPGGSPVQSDLIGGRVRDLAAETEKPVIAFVEDVAASGGYWIACAADEIIVNPNSIVGSIGVIYAGFGFQEAIGRLGIERRVHTAGDRKQLLDPFRPEKDEDIAYLKAIQGDMHRRFIDWVRARRGARLKIDAEPEMFEGKFWTGARGVELGLVDAVGELRRTMRERHGDKTRFRVLGPRRGLAQRLGLARAADPGLWIEAGLTAVEERAIWSRFGL
ncbi:MAG: S49 family peptidase [Alphaproteobacteria bacterium]|nr:S49 family peptidase [Alphaproteobacteria bacterium]